MSKHIRKIITPEEVSAVGFKKKKTAKYLMRSNAESYVNLIKELSIRG